MFYIFDPIKGVEVCFDADFVGSWTLSNSLNAGSTIFRPGYAIKFADCPMCWVGKM